LELIVNGHLRLVPAVPFRRTSESHPHFVVSPVFTEDIGDSLKNIRPQNNAIQTIHGQSNVAAADECFTLLKSQFHARILSRRNSNGKTASRITGSPKTPSSPLEMTIRQDSSTCKASGRATPFLLRVDFVSQRRSRNSVVGFGGQRIAE
jgi:hypothetical protein